MLRDLATGSPSSGVTILFFLVIIGVPVQYVASAMSKPPSTPRWARPKTTNSTQRRRDTNTGFVRDHGFPLRARVWFLGAGCPPVRIRAERYQAMAPRQQTMPQKVAQTDVRSYWWFEDAFYWGSGTYSAQDVLALVRQRKEQQRLQRAHIMLNAEQNAVGNRRKP